MEKAIRITVFSMIFILTVCSGSSAQVAPVPDTGQTKCYSSSYNISISCLKCYDSKGSVANCPTCYDSEGNAMAAFPVCYDAEKNETVCPNCFNSEGDEIICPDSGCYDTEGSEIECPKCYNDQGSEINCPKCYDSQGNEIICPNCYDSDGNEINCPGESEFYDKYGSYIYGQDGSYDSDTKVLESGRQRFTVRTVAGDKMADDSITGLTWEIKTSQNKTATYTWEEAATYIAGLNSDQFGGYSDWRLPTIRELAFIVDRDNYNPAVDTEIFPNTASGDDSDYLYWSSDTYIFVPADGPEEVWTWSVNFGGKMGGKVTGSPNDNEEMSYYRRYIRAVRGDEMPASVFTDNGDGTVTERITGLMWLKEAPETKWIEALTDCEALTFPSENGYSDWRLPDINEVLTLFDHSKNSLYEVFSGSSNHWSSTTRINDKVHVWRSSSGAVAVTYNDKGQTFSARAVRDAKVYDYGDIDHSDGVDLADAVLALKASAGLSLGNAVIYIDVDVNGDKKIGVEEVIYVLQYVAK